MNHKIITCKTIKNIEIYLLAYAYSINIEFGTHKNTMNTATIKRYLIKNNPSLITMAHLFLHTISNIKIKNMQSKLNDNL